MSLNIRCVQNLDDGLLVSHAREPTQIWPGIPDIRVAREKGEWAFRYDDRTRRTKQYRETIGGYYLVSLKIKVCTVVTSAGSVGGLRWRVTFEPQARGNYYRQAIIVIMLGFSASRQYTCCWLYISNRNFGIC